jgi:transcriptional regulator with XRE-family HTH domain
MLAQNLKYLRNKNKLSQKELADAMGLPRTTLGDYERGNTEPNIATLIKLADFFKLKIDDMLRKNLSHQDLEILKNKDLRVLAITVDDQNEGNIELVETKAEAGYLESFQNPEYIKDLPRIRFPSIPQGTYRGFQIQGDSMLPMEPGSIIICTYVEKLREIKDEQTYIVVSKSAGVVYKRVRNDANKNQLILISDNEAYLPYTIDYDEIDELWRYYAHLSFSDNKQSFHTMLEEKIGDIQQKLTSIHQTIVPN